MNAARRDLGEDVLQRLSGVLEASIRAGLDNRPEALAYARKWGRGLSEELTDRFVGMYVNELTCDYGDEGREAVRELLRRGEAAGAFRPSRPRRLRGCRRCLGGSPPGQQPDDEHDQEHDQKQPEHLGDEEAAADGCDEQQQQDDEQEW